MKIMIQKIFFILAITLMLLVPTLKVYSHAMVDVIINSETGKVELKDDSEDAVTDKKSAFAKVIENYNELITFFGGLATISFVAIFIKHFVELGAKATNPNERKEIVGGLFWSGIAAAGLGSVTFIFSLLFNVFK